jgi:hypothetical protein
MNIFEKNSNYDINKVGDVLVKVIDVSSPKLRQTGNVYQVLFQDVNTLTYYKREVYQERHPENWMGKNAYIFLAKYDDIYFIVLARENIDVAYRRILPLNKEELRDQNINMILGKNNI